MLDDLRASGVGHRVLFLEASEETLQTRYKETRRRHPLTPHGSVAEGIARERELLAPLRARADVVIDTSGLTASMLRRKLADDMLPVAHAAAGWRSRSRASGSSTGWRATRT